MIYLYCVCLRPLDFKLKNLTVNLFPKKFVGKKEKLLKENVCEFLKWIINTYHSNTNRHIKEGIDILSFLENEEYFNLYTKVAFLENSSPKIQVK